MLSKRRLIMAFVLMLPSIIELPLRSNLAAATTTSTTALFKVGVIQSEGPPIGCVSTTCPNIERKIAAYETQVLLPELGSASRIQTASFYPAAGMPVQGGCAILSGALKCWGGNKFGQLGDESTDDSPTALVTAKESGAQLKDVTDVSTTGSTTCVVTGGAVKCVGLGFGSETVPSGGSFPPNTKFGRTWKTVVASGATKVRTSGSEVCYIKTDETYWCATNAEVPNWIDSGLVGIKDADVCVAGVVSYCKSFGMTNSTWTKVTNADNAEAVYYQANTICFYRLKALWCASQMGGGALTARLIGVMPKPLAVINMAVDFTSTQMFFVLPTGILTALTGMISCESCYTSSNGVISKLSAFNGSTSTSFNHVVSINGYTNSLDYVPMTVMSDSRTLRTMVPINVKTRSGEALSNATIRWNAPDAPGTISSGSNPIVTDSLGDARANVVTGPVSFTVQGGTVKSGASLQAATVTTVVPSSGTVTVIVPDPPEVVDRKVSVVMSDGTPVPSASIILRNSYLAYAYQFVDTDVATWGAQASDSRGYFGKVMCAWCFVPPPAYITGADGTITFKTFNTGGRSTDRDVDVTYDDGSLAQTVKHSFGNTADIVTMSMMASTRISTTDADPSTPSLDVAVSGSGTTEIEVSASDASRLPMSGLTTKVESVCDGMNSGGLWKSDLKLDNICTDVSTSSVRSLAVSSLGSCNQSTAATSTSDGRLKITLCPLTSTRYRIRGLGAVPTQAFCVVVAKQPCGAAAASGTAGTQTSTTSTATSKSIKRGRSVALKSLLRPAVGATYTYRVAGGCLKVGTVLRATTRTATCKVTLIEVLKKRRSSRTLIINVT